MSGRTRNHRVRGAGRGSRGKTNINVQQKKTPKKKTLEGYIFYVGTSTQASDYKTTAEFLINYVKKTINQGNNVAETLCNLVKFETDDWKPKLK
eukprot:2395529-Ditylum_brightwellii.AAC.1